MRAAASAGVVPPVSITRSAGDAYICARWPREEASIRARLHRARDVALPRRRRPVEHDHCAGLRHGWGEEGRDGGGAM
jgi:hypothetical protein